MIQFSPQQPTQERAVHRGALQMRAAVLRRVLCWLHVAMFAAFSGLAPGTMLAVQSSGLTLVLCTGAGPVSVTLDKNGEPVQASRDPCAWSVHSAFVDPGQPASAGERVEFHAFVPAAMRAITDNSRDWSDQNRPRGPPRFL